MRVAFVPRSTEIKPLFWRFVLTTLQLIHRVRKRGAWCWGWCWGWLWGERSGCVWTDSAIGGWGWGLGYVARSPQTTQHFVPVCVVSSTFLFPSVKPPICITGCMWCMVV